MSNEVAKQNPIAHDDPRGLNIAGDVIGRQLQEISALTRGVADQLGSALGVNQTDLAAMEHLITDGPLPPSELAARLKVTTAGITQVIDRLERVGHVVRQRQLDDKRRVLVQPMQTSVALTYQHIAPMLNALDNVLSALDSSERATIEQFLGKVIGVYRTTLQAGEAARAQPAAPVNTD